MRSRAAFTVIAVLGAVLVALLSSRTRQMAEHEAIRQLSEPERRALYQRTLRTLASSCDPAKQPDGLEKFCRDQADLVLQFPDCDQRCLSLAQPHQTRPTK